jgi:diguanylate cyclase (GGDEF)-like protein
MSLSTIEAPVNQGLRVLVVDDDQDDLFIFRQLIGHVRGYRIELTSTSSYQAGLELVRNGQFDLHFVDYRLGSGSGLDLISTALEEDPAKAFVVVTGLGDENLAAESIRRGAVDYVAKSELSSKKLAGCISNAVTAAEQRATRMRREYTRIFDEATGVYANAAFHRTARHRLGAGVNTASHWGLLFLDIDNFAHVRDGWGAAVADETLRKVANSLRARATGHDLLGRYGEDEFCILTPCSGRKDAKLRAERFRAGVEDDTEATVSIGVCAQPSDAAQLNSMIDAAVIAMHEAIEFGRNRVELWERT